MQAVIRFTAAYLHSWKRPRTTSRGRLYDPGGKDLRKAKADMLKQAQDQGVEAGEASTWELNVQFVQADRRKRDIDRMLSFALDALEGALYANDNQVSAVNMEKHFDPTGANCVFIEAHPAD